MIKLIVCLLAIAAFCCSHTAVLASADDYEVNPDSSRFGFGDLFSTNEPVEPAPTTQADHSVARWEPIVDVSLSERFINNVLKNYVSPDSLLKELYFGFDTSSKAVAIRGKIQISEVLMAGYGLPSEMEELWFESTLKLKVTPSGYLGIIFPKDLTTLWPGSVPNPEPGTRIKVPNGFLEVIIARAREALAVMSGDFSSYEKRAAVIRRNLDAETRKLSTLTGYEREETELYIEELEMELSLLKLKTRRAKLKIASDNRIVKFVGDAEYISEMNLNARNNCILINPNLDKMFPFLAEVRPGEIHLKQKDGSRYLVLTVDSLIRR